MLERLQDYVTTATKSLKTFWERYFSANMKVTAIQAGMVVFASYLLASAAASLSIPLIMKSLGTLASASQALDKKQAVAALSLTGQPNYHEVRKAIIERNIFNLDNEYPDEKEEAVQEDEANTKKKFDADAPCLPCKLKIALVGTIVMGDNGSSMATIKEQGYDEVDIYRVGDLIVGNDNAQVMQIQRNRVVLNHNGAKECLVIDAGPLAGDVYYGSEPAKLEKAKGGGDAAGGGGSVLLQASWVEGELGDGFGKVIQSARIVPNTVDNRVNGFKIFAIQKGTLFDKIGLQNGDVITQVNETVLEAEQGFALYQAFLDERDISVRALRNGKTPVTLQVRIK